MTFLKMHECCKQTCTFKKEEYKGKLCRTLGETLKTPECLFKIQKRGNDEKDNTFSEYEKIAETFNQFLGEIKKINIPINSDVLEDVSTMQDPIMAAIEKYKQHPSILRIKKQIRIENYFDFKHIYDLKRAEVLKDLNAKLAK